MSTAENHVRGLEPGLPWRDHAAKLRRALIETAVLAGATLSEMPFLDHLEELRNRLWKSLVATGIGMAVSLGLKLSL